MHHLLWHCIESLASRTHWWSQRDRTRTDEIRNPVRVITAPFGYVQWKGRPMRSYHRKNAPVVLNLKFNNFQNCKNSQYICLFIHDSVINSSPEILSSRMLQKQFYYIYCIMWKIDCVHKISRSIFHDLNCFQEGLFWIYTALLDVSLL